MGNWSNSNHDTLGGKGQIFRVAQSGDVCRVKNEVIYQILPSPSFLLVMVTTRFNAPNFLLLELGLSIMTT